MYLSYNKMYYKLLTIIWIVSIMLAGSEARFYKRDTVLIERTSDKQVTMRPNLSEYLIERQNVMDEQQQRLLGSDIVLNEKEQMANEILMRAKLKEIDEGFQDPFKFAPARHLFEVLNKIKESEVFHIIEKMPKGAILHAHDTALVSADFLVTLTYRDNLWICNDTDKNAITFRFSLEKPSPNNGYEWKSVANERVRIGNAEFDKNVRPYFTLFTNDPLTEFKDINDVWVRFMKIFMAVEPLVTYAPVWKEYYKHALKEFYADGVQYLEFRGLLPPVYDLYGRIYTQVDIVQMYKDTLEEFKAENSGFIGSRFIYAPLRFADDVQFAEYISTLKELHEKFPDFVAGFDLVGQEDKGRPLLDFAETLLSLPESIKFFFHAGETNWFDKKSDDNLVDAILLGTSRIGHGFAISKHPKLLEMIKKRGIAVEVNPVSNQVLKLVQDNRNHPAAVLFADDYPVVVSSDDPSFWETKPLSHDFYLAFLGMASSRQDLRFLKKLALNSLNYSAIPADQKADAIKKWQIKWDEFIEDLLEENSNLA